MTLELDLIKSAKNGDPAGVKRALEMGAYENYLDRHKRSPLDYAVQAGCQQCVEYLLRGRADTFENNRAFSSLKETAERLGWKRTVKLCADRELLWSAKTGDMDQFLSALEDGARIKIRDFDGVNALQYACRNGRLEIARHALEMGCNPNTQDRDGWTALHFCVEEDHAGCIDLLLESGADIDARDGYGTTPLLMACERKSIRSITTLVARGANLNLQDEDGLAPLHAVCAGDQLISKQNRMEALRALVYAGCDLEIKSSSGETPLGRAVRYALDDCATELIDLGASYKDVTMPSGKALFEYAKDNNILVVASAIERREMMAKNNNKYEGGFGI